MFLRVVALAAGLTGAVSLSQFPEYSQQYMQRLGGAVDELERQVTRYEADAARVGLELDAYLAALAEEGELSRTQAGNMASDIARHARLSEALARLEGAGPFARAKLAFEMRPDSEVAHRAWQSFKPAVPATFEGTVFAGAGFLAGWAALALVFAILRRSLQLVTAPLRGRGEV
ncbi:DUF2937 family protein [Mameliella sp.]|uniref:DUF2937 family protein n=1 Tax=Mameliella sp. TaxID=1924940 RepID=UPI003BA9D85D